MGRLWIPSFCLCAIFWAGLVFSEEMEGSPIHVQEVEFEFLGIEIEATLYLPVPYRPHLPGVIFLPGIMADVDQYASYAKDLAENGILVIVHPWYSPLTSDIELAQHAKILSDWVKETLKVDGDRVGIAGHSMGAKDAILAEGVYGGFKAIVAIDPDDSGDPSAADLYTPGLKAPLLLIGAELGWDAPDFCAPLEENYQKYFEKSPPGTIELTLIGADHVLMLDDPERFGYSFCRTGWADSVQVHDTTMRAVTAFFIQHLKGGAEALRSLPNPAVRIKPDSPQVH